MRMDAHSTHMFSMCRAMHPDKIVPSLRDVIGFIIHHCRDGSLHQTFDRLIGLVQHRSIGLFYPRSEVSGDAGVATDLLNDA